MKGDRTNIEVRAGDGAVYLIVYTKRRRFLSWFMGPKRTVLAMDTGEATRFRNVLGGALAQADRRTR